MRAQHFFTLLTISIVLVCAFAPVAVPAAALTGDYLVSFNDGVSKAGRDGWVSATGGRVMYEFHTGNAVWIRLPADRAADAERLLADPRVAHVEQDVAGIPDLVPNDPDYALQPHLKNDGYPDIDIQAEPAWDLRHNASGVKVAVIDDGFLLDHPDLVANFVPGWDCADNDGDPSPDTEGSYYTHGTAVAGLIAAVGDNGLGVAGVCWDVEVMPLKHHRDGSFEYSGSIATAVAVDRAVAAGVDVIVCSFHYLAAGLDVSPSSQFYRSYKAASDAGIIVVASAGNDSRNLDNPANARYPACFDFPNVVTVACVNVDGIVQPLASSYGPQTVEIAAPGFPVQTTWVDENREPAYRTISGTSAAAALVGGVIAMIKAEHEGVPYPAGALALLYDRAEATAANVPYVIGGRRLNLYRALAEPDLIPPGAVTDLAVTGVTDTSVAISWTESGEDGLSGQLDHFALDYEVTDSPPVPVLVVPAPGGPGTVHSATIGDLPRGVAVQVTVTAIDEYRNRTSVPITVELPRPVVTADYTSAFFMARTGALRDSTIVFRNIGDWEGVLIAEQLSGGDWLRLPDEPLPIAPGASLALPYACDVTGMCAGFYSAQFGVIGSQVAPITISLLVLDAPQITLSSGEADFGQVAPGAVLESPLSIMNRGCSQLDWSAAVEPAVAGVVEPASGSLAPGDSVLVAVTIRAGVPGPAEVVVASNDPFRATTAMTVRWEADLGASPVDEPVSGSDVPVWESFPNPLNPRTTIRFTLPEAGDAELRLFDLRGAMVRLLPLGVRVAGLGTAEWDGTDEAGRALPSGTYFCLLSQAGSAVYPALKLNLVR